MSPLLIALISAGAPTVLSIVNSFFTHLATKSHNDTVKAVVASAQPAAATALNAGVTALAADPTKAGAEAAGKAALAAGGAALLAAPLVTVQDPTKAK